MRATRAYLAGVGTSGSLLAGAAVLFLLGSAIVAFKGWPQIGAGPATSNVIAAPLPTASRIARRLTVVLASTRPPTVAKGGAHVTTRARTKATSVVRGGTPVGGSAPATTIPATPAGSPAESASSTGLPAVGGCGSCSQPTSGNPVTDLSGTVTRTVSTVGTDVGNQIKGLSGTAGGQVGTVSSQAGSTVTSTGSSVGDTVTGATNTVASAVSTATGGGH